MISVKQVELLILKFTFNELFLILKVLGILLGTVPVYYCKSLMTFQLYVQHWLMLDRGKL